MQAADGARGSILGWSGLHRHDAGHSPVEGEPAWGLHFRQNEGMERKSLLRPEGRRKSRRAEHEARSACGDAARA